MDSDTNFSEESLFPIQRDTEKILTAMFRLQQATDTILEDDTYDAGGVNGSRRYDQSQEYGTRNSYKPRRSEPVVRFDPKFWTKLTPTQREIIHNGALEGYRSLQIARSNVRDVKRPTQPSQSPLGAPLTSPGDSVSLPDHPLPQIEATPTLTKADPTLSSQFEVPKHDGDSTDQETLYSRFCNKVNGPWQI